MSDSESNNYFQQLRLQMADAFSMDELQALSFDLGLDWAELAGETKSAKIISLLITIGQNEQLDALIEAIENNRPNREWPKPHKLSEQKADFAFFLKEHQVSYQMPIAYTADVALTPQQMRNRQNFLNNMKSIWIDGILYGLLHKYVIVTLNKTYVPQAIARGSRSEPSLHEEDRNVQAQKTIEVLFEESGRKLLILGSPGSGKTITLLQLALDLVNKAQKNGSEPMPVILNLSSWNRSWPRLEDWLIEEIFLQYQVARELAATWLTQNQFVLLLDGLDEVPTKLQNSCVTVINDFLAQYASEMVVCSRIKEYEQLEAKLNLGNAVELNPFTREQVNQFLVENDPSLHVLREILPQDKQLQELAKSPLMLSIMTLAYQGISLEDLEPLDTVAKRREHLFEYYVNSMFRRKPTANDYTQMTAIQWLTNIAQYMYKSSLAAFQIEAIQPTWLTGRKVAITYWLTISTSLNKFSKLH